jgi:hypothetical protein
MLAANKRRAFGSYFTLFGAAGVSVAGSANVGDGTPWIFNVRSLAADRDIRPVALDGQSWKI